MPETKKFTPPNTCSVEGKCYEIGECHARHLLENEMNTSLSKKLIAIASLLNNIKCTHPSYLALREQARLLLASQK